MPKNASETVVGITPFGVEADAPRNEDLLIQSIPGLRLRGAMSSTKGVMNEDAGVSEIPHGQLLGMGGMPNIPGMQIFVDPEELSYKVIDPLHEDEELCIRITRFMNNRQNGSPTRTADRIRGVKPQEGVLDPHSMKTLCRELSNIVKAGEGKVVAGELPTTAEIKSLPGEFLLNPGSRVQNTQPRFEKDFDAWISRTNHLD